jgi:hypothetical protein
MKREEKVKKKSTKLTTTILNVEPFFSKRGQAKIVKIIFHFVFKYGTKRDKRKKI